MFTRQRATMQYLVCKNMSFYLYEQNMNPILLTFLKVLYQNTKKLIGIYWMIQILKKECMCQCFMSQSTIIQSCTDDSLIDHAASA